MPRSARIDCLDILQHVMVRGIEKQDIFLDEADRTSFLQRFSRLLQETSTDCLAWALMRNHFHLLLCPKAEKLSTFMRRLLTGYAVTFNKRHRRVGHLFQNRYKSIVCEEEPYLLELVRYIHLNPLRANAVPDIDALDFYPWCGHAVLLGTQGLAGQKSSEVLARFGSDVRLAREAYRRFIIDGIGLGRREELCGGGLRRVLKSGVDEEPLMYDERVLGSGEFVQQLVGEPKALPPMEKSLPLDVLVGRVAGVLGLSAEEIRSPGRSQAVVEARSLISYLAYKRMGHNGEAVAKVLGITRSGVCRRSRAGEALFQTNKRWLEKFFR